LHPIRPKIVCVLTALSAAFLAADGRAAAAPPSPRPNVLFVLTDDQRADTIHALGNAHIATPNLDLLAQSGFAFRNAYCMGSDRPAVCLPSRAMLLSGMSLFHLSKRKAQSPDFLRGR
jgi:hypothetical protein